MRFFVFLVFVSQMWGVSIIWDLPIQTISKLGVDATDQQVVVHRNGDVDAVWIEDGKMTMRSKPFGESWGTLTQSASGASQPKIAIDPSGNAAAVWVQSGVINEATKNFGGAWAMAGGISGTGASQPDLAFNSGGDLYIVWSRSGNVESKNKPFGGVFSSDAQVISSAAAVLPKVVATSSDVYAVWEGTSGENKKIYYSTAVLFDPWSLPVEISSGSHQATKPSIARDASENIAATWFEYDVSGSDYSNVQLYGSYRPSGGAWETAQVISDEVGMKNPAQLMNKVIIGPNIGTVLAVWTNSLDGATFGIRIKKRDPGGVWEDEASAAHQNIHAYSADLVTTQTDSAFLGYMYFDPYDLALTIAGEAADLHKDLPLYWSTPEVFTDVNPIGYPIIGASSQLNTHKIAVIWKEFDGSNVILQAITGTGVNPEPPTSFVGSQLSNKQGIFTEYYNHLTWVDSTTPSVEKYAIFRNGVLIDSVPIGAMVYDDRNQVQSLATTYEIMAVDNDHFLYPFRFKSWV